VVIAYGKAVGQPRYVVDAGIHRFFAIPLGAPGAGTKVYLRRIVEFLAGQD
jgi:hypothetical protein